MTEKEAIKQLNLLDEALNHQRFDAGESSQALQMAIAALNKQITKKTNIVHSRIFGNLYECPTCHTCRPRNGHGDYCKYCGQKLDWLEEKEE
jgi:rRNA maturation endonuclease Nob1